MNNSNEFTPEYVLKEISNLRTMMGTKSFWNNLESAGTAITAILYAYANMCKTEKERIVATAISTITTEYDNRLAFFVIKAASK